MSRDQEQSETEERQTTTAEKLTLGLSILILLTVAGLIVYQALTGDDQPARFTVRPQFAELRLEGDHYYLPVDVTNEGKQTAEDLTVFFTLETLGGSAESSSFTIRFLESGATARGVAVFGSEPTEAELRYTLSYLRP